MKKIIEKISPDSFEQENHYYPKVLNSQLHPLVSHFFNLDKKRIVKRYVHLNPRVDSDHLEEILSYKPKYFYWGGADLFYVTTNQGNRRMVVLETNSCPSGQKSMPERSDDDDHRGYRQLIEKSFIPALKGKKLPKGALAVIYDKNYVEASGYAATIADLRQEDVYLVPLYDEKASDYFFKENILHIRWDSQEIPIRAAFRYVTQKPWNRIPIHTKTFIYNSTLACLAGGRNKLVASKAYEVYNSTIKQFGLSINTPETIRDVNKLEIPLWLERFGGYAVVKNPYSNAGQGVYTITNEQELKDFMSIDHDYDQFIVQSLIGHSDWSSEVDSKKYYHIGTVPNKRGSIFVADLRMMICSSPNGPVPCAVYARRAENELRASIPESSNSWGMLGTNLSIKKGKDQWESDTSRLVLMDRKEFNTLGIGIDDLIEAYIQSVLSIVAIDKMAKYLVNKKGKFRSKLFKSLDNDKNLLSELVIE